MDREASQKEREKDSPTYKVESVTRSGRICTELTKSGHSTFKKDTDFINDGVKVHIGEEAKSKLMDTLAADVDFLAKLHLMDYSLLLGREWPDLGILLPDMVESGNKAC